VDHTIQPVSIRRAFGSALKVAVFLWASVAPMGAQTPTPVMGRVLDRAELPLAGAVVEVVGTRWSAVTAADGRFQLRLGPGAWQIRATRIGYLADTASVVVGDAGVPEMTLRLTPSPIALSGLTVEGARAPTMARTVTTETVRQVPPLGEPDVFRALVLLPGVQQPNDLKGRIHLAGGASDETGVRLDGHPLQDPFHLLGLMGAFNVAALERADVLIHYIPPAMDGRLSGVIDLETRRPTGVAAGETVVSALSASTTIVRGLPALGVDVLASGRVTYLDKVVELLFPEARIGGDEIPLLGFHDAIVRVGRTWGGGWRTEALGFTTRDLLRTTAEELAAGYQPLTWGETLAGFRTTRSGERWGSSMRISTNQSRIRMEAGEMRPDFVHSSRRHASAAFDVSRQGERWQASAGASTEQRRFAQRWLTGGFVHEIFSPNTPVEYEGTEDQSEHAVYGELERDLGGRLTATLGGRATRIDGRWHPAPRGVLALTLNDGLRMEAAYGRRLQFDAELEEPIEGNITPPRFLINRPRVADVAAISAQWRGGGGMADGSGFLRVEGYWKRYSDRTLLRERERWNAPPPTFPDFVRITGSSTGTSLSGQWNWGESRLVQGSYSYQRVRERVDGRDYPTAWDAPHDLSLFATTPVTRGWTVNAAYAGRSGRATTPVEARVFVPSEELQNWMRIRYIRGDRNSVRIPPYHRLDVGGRRTWNARGAEWTLFAQVLNVLFRDNPIDFDWYDYFQGLVEPGTVRPGRPGLPIVPSLGVEVKW
jgi:hypothetical protein